MSDWNPTSESILAGSGRTANSLMGLASDSTGALSYLDPKGQSGDFSDARMLRISSQSWRVSEDYFNSSQRNRIVDAMALFRSQHPMDSKYNSDAYRRRSKLFRPKTRTTVRSREAAAIISMFATADIVNLTPADASNTEGARDARLKEMVLNYLLQKDRDWYAFVVGAVQDADRQGIVIASVEWEFREATRYFDIDHPELGRFKKSETYTCEDRPHMRLIPVENFRFSPAASWMDVVKTSPYLIEQIPMYVDEIRAQQQNGRARLRYRALSDGELMKGVDESYDPVRLMREGNKLDRYSRNGALTEYTPIWVRRNIVRIEGEDYVYDTIGDTVMLSDVVPLSEMDHRNRRPYVVGSAMLESHNPFPDGAVTLQAPLQEALNDNSNLRMDANRLSIAGRMFVNRSAGIDLHALSRFAPGAAVEMDNIDSVRWDRPPSPTSQAYEETQILENEVDALIGAFNSQSVATAKGKIAQTVGGMQMLSDSASQMTEYDLHTLSKTFLTDVLRHTLELTELYLTDRSIARIIGAKAGYSEKQFWQALTTPVSLSINIGMGATNPMMRLSRLTTGLETMGKFFPYLMMLADQSEITSEVFGACGYPDATRFFPFMDPKSMQDPKYATLITQLEQMRMMAFPHIAQAQGRAQQGQAQAQGRIQAAQITGQSNLQKQTLVNQSNEKIRAMELELAKVELQIEQEKAGFQREQLLLQREKLSNDIAVSQATLALEAQGTPLANPHAQEMPPSPADAQLEQQLRTPPSGDVPVLPVHELFRRAAQIPADGTGADLHKALTEHPHG